ncbi:phosphoribosylglycinamide formyltransferase [Salinimonas sediminis]|uniref:Phosphoribosylglycinamide formyltransferase n=1 Tax=Salinimonas sediminis TaxID=2303538 RepID=A0A346NMP7_9ALTE|nr:phosphoribosylglycinamide formyltransferase [Salinimonas sediminis]AXR06804.1 phosphoribosylglycinamide formyltransferase [Salinimonas sediminis]
MKQPTKICVLISGTGTNLQAILDAIDANRINGEVVRVISSKPGVLGLTRAQDAGIDAVVLDHAQYETRESYDNALSAAIDECDPACIVLAGFMRILTPDFVTRYAGKLLNVHPSLLPKYKGLNTHQRALDNKDTEHGVSVHFVTPELDGGPVIVQSRVPVFEDDTAQELAERVREQELNLYPVVVNWFCEGRLCMQNNKAILDNEIIPSSGYASD